MSYKADFSDHTGWSAVDTNRKTNGTGGQIFRDYLKSNGVETVIRYYASSHRSKTISKAEAKVLSADGFNILPVYQDNARLVSDFGGTNGIKSAQNALMFADHVGQPDGTTILFAVDTDFSVNQINQYVVPYFDEIKANLGGRFRIGAYGSGATLSILINEGLIEVPWISMSRAFGGTKDFFYSGDWAFRQVPPDRTEPNSGFGYDRNVLNWSSAKLGSFKIASNGDGIAANVAPLANVAPNPPGSDTIYVKTEGLNFRDAPNGTSLTELTIGDKGTDLGPTQVAGWRKCSFQGREGYAYGRYLRRPASDEVESLVAAAIAEWVRFEKGAADEKDNPYYKYVGEMWTSIGETWDGRSKYPSGKDVPWSAAFISFVVKNAGPAYRDFKFSAGHSKFVHDAIQARILNKLNKPFWGYRRSEIKPDIGDIIHRNRGNGNYSFDWAETHSQFTSHSDIVTEVRDKTVRVMGGNVGDTVSTEIGNGKKLIQEYNLDSEGYILPGQRVIAVLKNRADDVS